MAGWALWAGPMGVGGWLVCRGLARLGDSASPPTLIRPGVPPATPTQAEEGGYCPSFPAPPHGDRIWGLTPSPVPGPPSQQARRGGCGWDSRTLECQAGAKGTGWEASHLNGGLASPFGEIGVLVVLGSFLSLQKWGGWTGIAGVLPSGSLSLGGAAWRRPSKPTSGEVMSLLHHLSRQGFVSSNLEFSWPPHIQLGADSFYCLLIPSVRETEAWSIFLPYAHLAPLCPPRPRAPAPTPPSRPGSLGAPLSHTRELSKQGLWWPGL